MRTVLRVLLLGLTIASLNRGVAVAEPRPPDETDEQLANQYIAAGTAAQHAGDYDMAIALYRKAYALVRSPVLVFDLAQAFRLAGHPDQAVRMYARYLDDDPDGAQAPSARAEIAAIEAHRAEQAGALVISARSASGTAVAGALTIDHGRTRKLVAGTTTLNKLAPGDHVVTIDAGGYQRFETTVTVRGDQRTTLDAVLLEPPSRPRPALWKWTLAASASTVVSGAAAFVYSTGRMNAEAWKLGPGVSSDDCGAADARLPATLDRRAFDAACSWHRRATISYAAAGVGLLGSVISTIVLLRDPGPADTTAARPSRVAVAPIVTPAGGGAALSLAW